MPPRKSNVSVVSNGGGGEDAAASSPPPSKAQKEGTSIEDLTLPRSIIGRLAKGILPPNTNIGKDALLALHKSATVFVSYIATTANENAQSSGKKTIMPADVVQALKDGDFAEFLPRLEAELKKYNEVQCDKRNSYRRRVKEEKAAAQSTGEDNSSILASEAANGTNGITSSHVEGVDDSQRPTKKIKGENGAIFPSEGDVEDEDDADELNGDAADADEPSDEDDQDDGADEDDELEDEDEDTRFDDADEQLRQEQERAGMRDEALDGDESD